MLERLYNFVEKLVPSGTKNFRSKVFLNLHWKILAAFVISFIVSTLSPDSFEGKIYNLYHNINCQIAGCKQQLPINLIYISKRSLEELNQKRNLSPELWIRFATKLQQANPKLVGFTEFNTDFLQNDFYKSSFRNQLKKIPNVVFGRKWDSKLGMVSPIEDFFAKDFHQGFQEKTTDTKSFAKDRVTRRAFLTVDGVPTFSTKVAELIGIPIDTKSRGIFENPIGTKNFQFFINYYGQKNNFRTYEFVDVLNGKHKEDLKNKIVYVGYDDLIYSYTYSFTPYHLKKGQKVEIPLAELKAHETSNLIKNDWLIKASPLSHQILIYGLSTLILTAAMSLTPLNGIIFVIASLLIIFALAALSFLVIQVWFLVGSILLSVLLCYYAVLPVKLIQENKRRWEIQKKHSLLIEVEELKTNFISLVSHDLKTPIARIQSMAELGLDDPNVCKMPRQKQVLDGIIRSVKELQRFIGNILNLSRIESGAIPLAMKPTDLNQLIENIVSRTTELAVSKSIQIEKKLEPIFPIVCDPTLVEQMLCNLIENAIRYSPSGTTVVVKTEEIPSNDSANPLIKIMVVDQGVGIEEKDLERVFQKFYRGRNPNKLTTKGSGLGLYLVKYFTELHGGGIKVQSKLNEGSTFTITLPSVPPTKLSHRATTELSAEDTRHLEE